MRLCWAILFLTTVCANAFGWNKAGHMVSAAIAFEVLKKDSPATIPHIIALLKEQPKFDSQWEHRLASMPNLSDDEKDLYLFMLAARWADDVRDDSEYHHATWHYINLPYKPPGQPDSVTTRPPDPDNIIRAFELNLVKLKDKKASPRERAMALCWMFHVVGDAHQPLHTSSMFTTEYPRGDKGGNKFMIRVRANNAPISLHQFWDDLIIGSDRFQSVRNKATELRLRPDFARDKLNELRDKSFGNWINKESFRLVNDVVYRQGRLKGGTEPANAETLPEDYPSSVKPVAERQIVLAGYRLAEVLRSSFAEMKP